MKWLNNILKNGRLVKPDMNGVISTVGSSPAGRTGNLCLGGTYNRFRTKRCAERNGKSGLVIRPSLIVLLISIISFTGCQRETDDFLGNEVIKAPDGFSITTGLAASTSNADFAVSPVDFTATLSDKVSWQISITGLSSGAKKTIYGVSNSIDATVASWDGASDNIYHFRNGETVTAILSVTGSDLTDTVTLAIISTKVFAGTLVADYDGAGTVTTNWWESFKPGELISVSEDYSDIVVPQGTECLHLKGEDVSPDGFIGQSGHSGVAGFDFSSFGLPGDPDSVYFNCYVNGSVGTELEFRMVQTVGGAGEGDEYSYYIPITWSGWKLISVKYSNFVNTLNANATPGQSGEYITRIKFVIRALTAGDEAEANIDYPIFTINKGFEQ